MKPNQSAKRVDIVSIKLVKEVNAHSHGRTIHRQDDGYTLVKKGLTRSERISSSSARDDK